MEARRHPLSLAARGYIREGFEPHARARASARRQRWDTVVDAAKRSLGYDSSVPFVQALMQAFIPSPIVCEVALLHADRPLRVTLPMILDIVEPAMFSGGWYHEPMKIRHLPIGPSRHDGYWRGRLGNVRFIEAKPRVADDFDPQTDEDESMDMTVIARVAYEVTRAFMKAVGVNQPAWDLAHSDLRQSAHAGARNVAGNPDMTPRDMHNSWLAQRTSEGWVYGEERDLEAKTHPCIKAWDDLDSADQIKHALFRAAVLAGIGREVKDFEAIEGEREHAATAQADRERAAAEEAAAAAARAQEQAEADAAAAREAEAAAAPAPSPAPQSEPESVPGPTTDGDPAAQPT